MIERVVDGGQWPRHLSSGLAVLGGMLGGFLVGIGAHGLAGAAGGSLLLCAYAVPHLTGRLAWDERDRAVRERAAKRAIDAATIATLVAVAGGGVLVVAGQLTVTSELLIVPATVFVLWALTGLFEANEYANAR